VTSTAAASPGRASGASPGRASDDPSRAARWVHRFWFYLPAVLVFVGTIGVWEFLVGNIDLRGLPLPAPSAIVSALGDNWSAGRWPLAKAASATLFEALGGLAIGTSMGVAVAFLTARFATARELLLPLAVGASAVPIIAFAPLMNNWFGVLNPLSKMMIVAVLVFFPVVVNVTRGLTQVEPAALELLRSYATSEWTILRVLRLPNALPYFFTALKIGTTLSLIGAIVGEYFGGSSEVLGRVVVQSASALRFDVTWAAIILAAVTGIVMYLAIVAIERVVIPWHASVRSQEP
jgi:NitT/TauT family transport system permease protein